MRKQRGWTQYQLAAAGVTPSVISRLERNLQRDFDLSAILGIARALDVSIDSLLATPVVPSQESVPELQQALDRVHNQPPDIQSQVARMIQAFLSSLEQS